MFKKYRPIKITLDPLGPRADRPEAVQRLQRIAQHYEEFERVFVAIESQLTQVEPLAQDGLVAETEVPRPRKPR